MTEDEKVGWHHRPDGHEFEQAPGVGDGQGGLACCSPRGHKDSDTAEQLNKSYLAPSPISEFFFGVVFLYPVPPCPPTNTVHESLPTCLSHSAIMIFSYVTSHQRQNPFPSLSEGSNTCGLSAQELRVHAVPINHKVSRCSRALQLLSPPAWKQNPSSEIRVCLCRLLALKLFITRRFWIIPSPRWTEALPCISISS